MSVKSLKGRLNKAAAPSERVLVLNLDDIGTDPQVRTKFDPVKLKSLAEQITASGLMQPIVVRETPNGIKPYTVHVGERRFRACGIAGLETISVIVRDVDPKVARIQQFAENSDREDLSLSEEIAFVIGELKDMSGVELAAAIGKPATWVSKRKSLGNAGPATLKIIENNISGDMEAIYDFSRLEKSNPDKANAFLNELESGDISAENFRDQVKEILAPKPKATKTDSSGENGGDQEPEEKGAKPKGVKELDKFFTVSSIEFEDDYIKVDTDQGLLIFDNSLADYLAKRSG